MSTSSCFCTKIASSQMGLGPVSVQRPGEYRSIGILTIGRWAVMYDPLSIMPSRECDYVTPCRRSRNVFCYTFLHLYLSRHFPTTRVWCRFVPEKDVDILNPHRNLHWEQYVYSPHPPPPFCTDYSLKHSQLRCLSPQPLERNDSTFLYKNSTSIASSVLS